MERLKARFEPQEETAYHATDALSSHGIKALVKSPLHYYSQYVLKEQKETKARQFGTLAHLFLLDMELFEKKAAIEPEVDKRTKIGKATFEAWWGTLPPDAVTFKAEEHARLMRMMENIQAHPVASSLLKSGVAELSGFWTDFNTGIACKMRPDFLPEEPAVVDIKTTQDASYKAFQRALVNYRYDIQAAHYLDGYSVIMGKERDAVPFVWIALESEAPYSVGVYVASQKVLDRGRKDIEIGKRRYLEGKQDHKKWLTGYQTEAQEIDFPAWFQED